MFSRQEKKEISEKVEALLLELAHPEMPKERVRFKLHVQGAGDWSWADIEPNWKFETKAPGISPWNEGARKHLAKRIEDGQEQ